MHPRLFVFRQIDPDITVMDFAGSLTTPEILVAEVERFIKKRIECGCRKLVLDLTDVQYVDSSGVGLLVVCMSAMEQAGGRMVIAGASGQTKRALEVAHLELMIGMYSDVASACEVLAKARSATA
jgi:anti-sigma B factor antagonist